MGIIRLTGMVVWDSEDIPVGRVQEVFLDQRTWTWEQLALGDGTIIPREYIRSIGTGISLTVRSAVLQRNKVAMAHDRARDVLVH